MSVPEAGLRKTKIVCTIGPATRSPERIGELIEAGMDVARLNFSHGDREEHAQTIRTIRRVARELGKETGILQDLGGPKIRLGKLRGDERRMETGEEIVLRSGTASESSDLPVAYPYLAEDVEPGNHILLADGKVELLVLARQGESILCRVLVGGAVQSHKGINLPTSELRVPAFTEKDRLDLALGLEEGVDFVALSFIRSRKDLEPVLQILDQIEKRPLLIAKIEKPQAVQAFAEILARVDAVMVARGDLGVEMPLEEVPLVQKKIIRATRQAAKPVITATQMLSSMMGNPRPTRAEVTDVANAILDGTDAVMLSDETAMGAYPIEAVHILDRIARNTEQYLDTRHLLDESKTEFLPTTAAAISRAACWLALDLHAAAIVACTSSGSTARLVARFRPRSPVVALTENLSTLRQLNLSWGIVSALTGVHGDTDAMFEKARSWALQQGIAHPKDLLIITAGIPVGVQGTTNLVKVMEL